MNPRPPRCERGALPAELLPHLRAEKHSRRFSPVLSIRARRAARCANASPQATSRSRPVAPGRSPPAASSERALRLAPRLSYSGGTPGSAIRSGVGCARLCGRRGESFETIKFFSVLPIISGEQVRVLRREHAPYPAATEKTFAMEKTDGRKRREDEIAPSDGFFSSPSSRRVARVRA